MLDSSSAERTKKQIAKVSENRRWKEKGLVRAGFQAVDLFWAWQRGLQKAKRISASSGNRTRAARVAGEHSTTEPTMLRYRRALE